MKKMLLVACALLFSVHVAAAFEVHGLKSGMTMDQAKSALEKFWCGSIGERGSRMVAYPQVAGDPLLILDFKKGSLYRYQKRCLPEFAYFNQLVADKRRELGKPADALITPTNVTSTKDINCMEFHWNNGKYTCRISYAQHDPNSWMTITYEDKNIIRVAAQK